MQNVTNISATIVHLPAKYAEKPEPGVSHVAVLPGENPTAIGYDFEAFAKTKLDTARGLRQYLAVVPRTAKVEPAPEAPVTAPVTRAARARVESASTQQPKRTDPYAAVKEGEAAELIAGSDAEMLNDWRKFEDRTAILGAIDARLAELAEV